MRFFKGVFLAFQTLGLYLVVLPVVPFLLCHIIAHEWLWSMVYAAMCILWFKAAYFRYHVKNHWI